MHVASKRCCTGLTEQIRNGWSPRVPGGKTVLGLPLLESFAFLPPETWKTEEKGWNWKKEWEHFLCSRARFWCLVRLWTTGILLIYCWDDTTVNNMKDVWTVLLLGIVVFLVSIGLSYAIDGKVNWIIAIGTTIGFSIAYFLLKRPWS